mmetsp:Transcript_24687/g.38414  ORF Transcript_24687/g.38414 Transcript_24687/m.38414 type:complete len:269 (+) Transcript_24687:608-1414(+)
MTELAIIGADIQEVIGSATALYIIFGLPLWIGSLVTILDSFLFLFIHYFGVRKLEAFFAVLIFVMAVCFCLNMFTAKPDVGAMAKGLIVPTVPSGSLPAALGLVGAVIMPHNIYLYSSLVLTRKLNLKSKNQMYQATVYNRIDNGISLVISFVISTAVIATFASYIISHPDSPPLDLLTASDALAETFGNSAKYIWAIGLLAAGQSSTMTGTYAGQFVMEGFLSFKLPIWKRVLITRSVAIVPALVVVFLNQDSLTNMDSYLNVLQNV